MRRDEVRVDREAEDAQPLVEVVLPDRRVPVGRSTLELLGAPDVVDEDIDVAVLVADPLGQRLDLGGVEMVDGNCDARPAEIGDEPGRLLDRLGAVVVGAQRARRAAATGADDCGAGFAEGRCDAAPGAPWSLRRRRRPGLSVRLDPVSSPCRESVSAGTGRRHR